MRNGIYEDIDGNITWWKDGKLHNESSPAMTFYDGNKYWYLNGVEYTEEEFNQWLEKKNLNEKLQVTFEPKYKEKKNKV